MEDLLERRQFKGEPGDSLVIERLGQTPATLVLVGLGDPESHDAANLRRAGARAARAAVSAGARQLGLWMPWGHSIRRPPPRPWPNPSPGDLQRSEVPQ